MTHWEVWGSLETRQDDISNHISSHLGGLSLIQRFWACDAVDFHRFGWEKGVWGAGGSPVSTAVVARNLWLNAAAFSMVLWRWITELSGTGTELSTIVVRACYIAAVETCLSQPPFRSECSWSHWERQNLSSSRQAWALTPQPYWAITNLAFEPILGIYFIPNQKAICRNTVWGGL